MWRESPAGPLINAPWVGSSTQFIMLAWSVLDHVREKFQSFILINALLPEDINEVFSQ